ncbi:hypothetical protein [Rhizobium lusitanum]|uniref:hypothetical protein n=1 Tax=Rhizobium lusitanum TaxID=293958 RepID=UPI00195A78BE|nr:hypothetical protein [Rhizobium lusitanum]MBM7046321.1 hypothetical protein [Rhizobium lusitanum]
MIWSLDLTAAPLDRRIWLATRCEKVSVTRWNEKRGAWDGLATGETPIAWQLYVVPTHPHFQSDSGANAAFGAAGPSPEKACAPLSDHEYVERIGDRVIAERKIADAAADLVAHLGINDCGGGV